VRKDRSYGINGQEKRKKGVLPMGIIPIFVPKVTNN
jgi:hypothetical protein